jgi:hypothetical protein
MSALLALDELENSRVAHELIRLRLRVPIVHYLTNIHPKPLRMRWRQLHGESPHNGKLPDSVRPFITNPMMLAKLSSFVALYNRLDEGDGRSVTQRCCCRRGKCMVVSAALAWTSMPRGTRSGMCDRGSSAGSGVQGVRPCTSTSRMCRMRDRARFVGWRGRDAEAFSKALRQKTNTPLNAMFRGVFRLYLLTSPTPQMSFLADFGVLRAVSLETS